MRAPIRLSVCLFGPIALGRFGAVWPVWTTCILLQRGFFLVSRPRSYHILLQCVFFYSLIFVPLFLSVLSMPILFFIFFIFFSYSLLFSLSNYFLIHNILLYVHNTIVRCA
jgi:hypothetical protein